MTDRWIWAMLLVAGLVTPCRADEPVPEGKPGSTERAGFEHFIASHCLDCHDKADRTAELGPRRVARGGLRRELEPWEKVALKLSTRQMPPKEARPTEAQYQSALEWLEGSLDAAAAARPNPGRTETFRRLSRTEYQHAIRDLLALDVDVAALLPPDESSHGFDNITVSDLTPTLLNRYLSAAQKISRLAIGRQPSDALARKRFAFVPTSRRTATSRACRSARAAAWRSTSISRRTASTTFKSGWCATATMPIEGLRDAARARSDVGPPAARAIHARTAAGGPERRAGRREFEDSLHHHGRPAQVGVAFLKKSVVAVGNDRRQPLNVHFNFYRHPRLGPAVYQVSISGPFDGHRPRRHSQPPADLCRDSPSSPDDEEDVRRRIVANLARRAYRRPIDDDDLQRRSAFTGRPGRG